MKQRTILLQDELLILWGDFLTEMHDEFVRSCLHGHAALWLVGVIADFIPGRVLEKLEMEQPACASYPLVLTHPVTAIQNDLVSRDLVFTGRVIVKAVIL